MRKIVFEINGIRLTTESAVLTVRELLEQISVSPDHFYLERAGTEFREPDERVELQDGDKFTTKRRTETPPVEEKIHYRVNGEEQTTPHNRLTVEQILRNAGRNASIDVSQIDDYFLQRIEDDRKYETTSDVVDIHEGDQFLAVHRGRTPVA